MVIFTQDFSWGAAVLSAYARELGWEADILFLHSSDIAERFHAYVDEYRPDLVAISFMSYDRWKAFLVAEHARKCQIKVICGGIHPTFMPMDVAASQRFDAIVTGDGLGVWEEVLTQYRGLENSQIIKGKRHENRERYTTFFYSTSQIQRMKKTKSAMLLSSQGCPFKCRFCASSKLDYLAYSPDEIVGMMARLNFEFGVNNFQFFDDLFAWNAQRCRNLHKKVVARLGPEIKYGNFVMARASGFDEPLVEALVEMGVDCVNFGIETASPKLLSFLNKKQTQEDCYKAMEICRDYGLIRKVNLMFGIPTQDQDDYELTLQFVRETQPEIKSCFFYMPLPGSDLYEYCFDNNYLPASFKRHAFDWFEARPDGFADIQCRLKGIDYEMAGLYRDRIEQLDVHLEALLKRASIVDTVPWVIAGSSRTYYYKKFIEKLSGGHYTNCLGYMDFEKDGEFVLEEQEGLKAYVQNDCRPHLAVTYCHLDSEDYHFIKRSVEQMWGDMPLISLASFKNHSLSEIESVLCMLSGGC